MSFAQGEIMTDAEVAALLRIGVKTLQRRMRKHLNGDTDLRRAEPCVIGGRRFWVRRKVYAVIGLEVK